jgi:hypothetical protein
MSLNCIFSLVDIVHVSNRYPMEVNFRVVIILTGLVGFCCFSIPFFYLFPSCHHHLMTKTHQITLQLAVYQVVSRANGL